MIQVVWQFQVKQEALARFELAYGPGGAWSQLFASSPGFRGTVLLHDVNNPARYLTIDSWDTQELREVALAERKTEYSALDASFHEWTDSEVELGVYRLLAEGSVRPAMSAHQRRRDAHRRKRA